MTTLRVAQGEHILIVPQRWQDGMKITHPSECPTHCDNDALTGGLQQRRRKRLLSALRVEGRRARREVKTGCEGRRGG